MRVPRDGSFVYSGESFTIFEIEIRSAIDKKHDHFVCVVLYGSCCKRRFYICDKLVRVVVHCLAERLKTVVFELTSGFQIQEIWI